MSKVSIEYRVDFRNSLGEDFMRFDTLDKAEEFLDVLRRDSSVRWAEVVSIVQVETIVKKI